METGQDIGASSHTPQTVMPDEADHTIAKFKKAQREYEQRHAGEANIYDRRSPDEFEKHPAIPDHIDGHFRSSVVGHPEAHLIAARPGCFVEVTGDNSANYEFLNLKTQQAVEIVRELLPDMLNRFLAKNADYGDQFLNLGPKAEFVRMANKFGKLKQALWDGQELEFEQVDEILDDLLGHILLARLGLRGVDPNRAKG